MTPVTEPTGAAPGSMRHFALMYAAPGSRAMLGALYAYEAEIASTVLAASHEVAHVRLRWWRGEVDRLLGGAPEHPVTRALLELRGIAGDALALLHEPLVAADVDLARLTFANARELEAYCFRAAGAVKVLAAHASSLDPVLSEAEATFARRAGSAIRRAEMLRDLRVHLAAGRLPLPLDALERAGVAPPDLHAEPLGARAAELLEGTRAALREELRALVDGLERACRARQRPTLVLAALHARLLDHVDHRAALARTRAELPPWRKLWTAWHTARSAA